MRPSYLLLRNETYHLRLRVPLSLTAVIGCTELRLSLFETSRRLATLKAGYLAYQIRQFFSHVRRLMKHLPRTEIDRLVREWKTRMIDRDSEVRRLVETGLGNVSLADYGVGSDVMGDEYEAFANKRPLRSAAAYRGMTVAQLASATIAPESMQSKKRVAESIDRIKSFFRWCTEEHLIDRSPAQGLGAFLPQGRARPPREAWTKEEIRILLHPDNLRRFLDSRNQKGRRSKPQRYTYFPWLLVLATYTGARLNELGGLLVSDFEPVHAASDGETPVILIRPNHLRTLKTALASRAVPMHPHLSDLGIWDPPQKYLPKKPFFPVMS